MKKYFGQSFTLRCVDCLYNIRQLDENRFKCENCGRYYSRNEHGVFVFLPQKMDQHKVNEDALHVQVDSDKNWLHGKYLAIERCKADWAIKAIKAGECSSFLEVGSGLGFGSAIIKQAHPHTNVVCSDISPSLLSNKTIPICESLKVTIDFFVACDGETLPFDDAQFDCVYSAYALHRMLHPELFLNEAKRVLKPAGTLFIVDEAVAQLPILRSKDIERKTTRANTNGIVINAFTLEDWYKLLENSDLPAKSLNVSVGFPGFFIRLSNLVKPTEIQLRYIKP